MTLTELRYVVALARERHFGNAAQTCFVSQPTLSIAIKKMEEELGVKLFERGSNEVTLTAIGECVIEQASRVLEEVETIKHLVKEGRDPLKGPLRLGIVHTAIPYLLLNLTLLLRQLLPTMPLVIVENSSSRLVDMLRQGEIDAVICSQPANSRGFVELRPLYDEPLMFVMPKDHRFSGRESVDVEELESEKVLLTGNSCCLRDHILQLCPAIHRIFWPGMMMNRLIDGNSLRSLYCMIVSGVGVSVFPALAVRCQNVGDDHMISVCQLRKGDDVVARRLILMWRKRFRRKEAIDAMIKTIKKVIDCNSDVHWIDEGDVNQ
ncbi:MULTISPECIES: LysR substrate-binding domain-containing protein [Candidatus Ichthyocystis]|uniref:LysR family transcriptional regulator n=2 Tax=Candidatus Ichthyocystis hellenicum TaxID=1561003 RepID=A0A0S4M2B6_9BURK|nr:MULTISPECIES: LysR substrate-binding domain-containing protein [Ichthyocystis]CUT16890.1 LysR family transcriptional regulator [Candidatus Ichthyocystis hellenicum]